MVDTRNHIAQCAGSRANILAKTSYLGGWLFSMRQSSVCRGETLRTACSSLQVQSPTAIPAGEAADPTPQCSERGHGPIPEGGHGCHTLTMRSRARKSLGTADKPSASVPTVPMQAGGIFGLRLGHKSTCLCTSPMPTALSWWLLCAWDTLHDGHGQVPGAVARES